MLAFQYYPLLGQRHRVPGLPAVSWGSAKSLWSGLENFAVIFNGDPAFLNAVKNTLILTLSRP